MPTDREGAGAPRIAEGRVSKSPGTSDSLLGPLGTPNDLLVIQVYERLRSDITNGLLRPNERLIVTDLADQLSISRTPVREALQLLAAGGLIVSARDGYRQGYKVREHTIEEIREIYQVRAALEGMAARLVAESPYCAEVVAELEEIAVIPRPTEGGQRKQLVRLNRDFHTALLKGSNNGLLERINRNNTEQFFTLSIAQHYTSENIKAFDEEHHRIVQALRERDADAAERAAREHVIESLEVAVQYLAVTRMP